MLRLTPVGLAAATGDCECCHGADVGIVGPQSRALKLEAENTRLLIYI